MLDARTCTFSCACPVAHMTAITLWKKEDFSFSHVSPVDTQCPKLHHLDAFCSKNLVALFVLLCLLFCLFFFLIKPRLQC
jgi:hypothetical protein